MERHHNTTKHGSLAWLGVAAGVFVWDMLGSETLTHAFSRGMENPRSKPLVLAGLGITAAHLVGILPKELDPFYLAFENKDIELS